MVVAVAAAVVVWVDQEEMVVRVAAVARKRVGEVGRVEWSTGWICQPSLPPPPPHHHHRL